MFQAPLAWILLFTLFFPIHAQTPQLSQVSDNLVVLNKKEVITRDDIIDNARNVARQTGISEELFIRILLDESGASSTVIGDMNKICKKGPNKGKPVRARGAWQITECHWPEITDEQAFNPIWSTSWAAERFQEGRVDIWTTVFRQ